MAVTDLGRIAAQEMVEFACKAPNDAFLLLDWLNAVIYEMGTRRMVFGRFAVGTADHRLWGNWPTHNPDSRSKWSDQIRRYPFC